MKTGYTDGPLEDDEDYAAQNALYDMVRTEQEYELTQRDIELGGVDPRAPNARRRGRPPAAHKKQKILRLRRMQTSITVSVTGGVTEQMWDRFFRWIDDQRSTTT